MTDQADTQGSEKEPLTVPDAIREEWEVLTSGAVDVLPEKEFLDRVAEARGQGRPLRIKLGLDPSTPDLHVGHTVVINKLRQFQQFGHQVVVIVGDFTARIGDPAGKSETRKALSLEETRANAETYLEQVFLILDRDKTEVVRNSQWLEPMTMNEVIDLASKHTVARMLERDDFAKRYRAEKPIYIHEFLYPLVQAYDSIMVRADLELGGTDQKFNLLVGRDLMQRSDMRGQCVMTMPLIVGLDGVKKMSKSLGNAIGITEEPSEIYGKAMSIPDEMMPEYYRLVLAHAPGEVDKLEKRLGSGELHPRDAKAAMALELVERFHGEAAAKEAQARFDKVHRAHESPDDVEEISLAMKGPRLRLTEAMVRAGMAESKGQAKRLIRQGGVSVDDRRVSSEDMELTEGSYLLKVGRRRFRRIQLTSGGGG